MASQFLHLNIHTSNATGKGTLGPPGLILLCLLNVEEKAWFGVPWANVYIIYIYLLSLSISY